MATFRDHFSGHAVDYRRFRPRYPGAIFDWLAEETPGSSRAWDCATGNGQAAVALADHFDAVVATDASTTQIASATAHARVTYRVAPASASGLATASVDLVTVAQALHWFDLDAFTREAARVVRVGGLVAAWCYELFSITPAVDAPMLRLYRDIVGADWPPQRRHIEAGYRDLDWPWAPRPTPAFEMREDWTVGQVLGYLRTWSACQRWRAREGADPVALIEPELRAAWGDADRRPVHWPVQMLVSRVG